jgi:ring-1,2-phenylacetyl-CoA epoxidase subunit PaaE
MDANFALTDSEVEEGFILTCQAHPLTEKLVVDYDAM